MNLNTITLDKDGLIKAFEMPEHPADQAKRLNIDFYDSSAWHQYEQAIEAAIKIPFKDQRQVEKAIMADHFRKPHYGFGWEQGKHYPVPESFTIEIGNSCNACGSFSSQSICGDGCKVANMSCKISKGVTQYAILVPKQEPEHLYKCTCDAWGNALSNTVGYCPHCGKPLVESKQQPVKEQLCNCVSHTECECIYENKCSECGLPLRPTKQEPLIEYTNSPDMTELIVNPSKQPTSIEEAAEDFIDEDYADGFTAGVQSQEDIAIKFAEWIAVRYYSMHQSSNTWFDGEYRVGSTEKLFEIFKQENK
jgi:hypothetical protein